VIEYHDYTGLKKPSFALFVYYTARELDLFEQKKRNNITGAVFLKMIQWCFPIDNTTGVQSRSPTFLELQAVDSSAV